MSTRTIVVTGVANGIGAETARVLRSQNCRVIGLDRQKPESPVDHFIEIDLNSTNSISAATAQIDEPIHGLCNIAGLPPRDESESLILQVNFLGTRAFTAQLISNLVDGASIVNVASRAGNAWAQNMDQVKGLMSLPNDDDQALKAFVSSHDIDSTRAYNLSKEAMIVWSLAQTESLLSQGVRINTVSPGAVNTAILDDFTRAFGEKVVKNVKRAGRAGHAEEIAELIGFLVSPASQWVNGTDVPVDGGMGAFAISDNFQLADFALQGQN